MQNIKKNKEINPYLSLNPFMTCVKEMRDRLQPYLHRAFFTKKALFPTFLIPP